MLLQDPLNLVVLLTGMTSIQYLITTDRQACDKVNVAAKATGISAIIWSIAKPSFSRVINLSIFSARLLRHHKQEGKQHMPHC